MPDERPILSVRHLARHFPIRQGLLGRVKRTIRAVDGVSFDVYEGETLGLVGESGSGKSTLGRCIVRAHAPTTGSIAYRQTDGATVDLATLPERDLRPFRRELRMIFQDPFASLNPRMTVREIVGEPLLIQGTLHRRAIDDRVAAILQDVGLRPEVMRRYPHAFSGGQRQRIGIARALVLETTRLVVADEAVSALDVSVRAQILKLMVGLKARRNLTYLFISHDLSVVEYVADRVAVMYAGRLVEVGPTDAVYQRPGHPYSEALLSAVPSPDPARRAERIVLAGEVPDPADLPTGCAFHPRCRFAVARCRTEMPVLRETATGSLVACHLSDSLALRGVAVPGASVAPEASVTGAGHGRNAAPTASPR